MATTHTLFPGHILFLEPKLSVWVGFLNLYKCLDFLLLFFLKALAYFTCNKQKCKKILLLLFKEVLNNNIALPCSESKKRKFST